MPRKFWPVPGCFSPICWRISGGTPPRGARWLVETGCINCKNSLLNKFEIVIFSKSSIRFVIHLNRYVLCHFINKTRPMLTYFGAKKFDIMRNPRITLTILTNFSMTAIQTINFGIACELARLQSKHYYYFFAQVLGSQTKQPSILNSPAY